MNKKSKRDFKESVRFFLRNPAGADKSLSIFKENVESRNVKSRFHLICHKCPIYVPWNFLASQVNSSIVGQFVTYNAMLEQNYDRLFIHGELPVNYEIHLTNSALTHETQRTEILVKEAQNVPKVSCFETFPKNRVIMYLSQFSRLLKHLRLQRRRGLQSCMYIQH
jgi:hypothetical protein